MKVNEQIDERIWWDRLRNGDASAYHYIFQKYGRSLMNYGLKFTNDTELIKDAVQDVFIRLFKYRENLSPTDNIRLYLYISTKNQLIRLLSQRHIHFESLEEKQSPEEEGELSHEDEFIKEETEKNLQEQVKKAINELSPRQQEVIRYRYIDCLSLTEIEGLMEMNYQSVQNLLQRSLKKIREKIKKSNLW